MFLRRSIPVPPFIALAIIESKARNARQLGAELLATFIGSIEQDTNHILHSTVTSVAGKLAMRTILAWLFKAHDNFNLCSVCCQVYPDDKIDLIVRAIRAEKLSK